MRAIAISWAFLLLLLASTAQSAGAQSKPAHPDIPVQQWLEGPEHRDFPWNVEVSRPVLNLQQRYVVLVHAGIPADKLQAAGPERHLYFILKVADEQGHWFDDEGSQDAKLPARLDKHTDIVYTDGFYARPGRYRVALIAYDSTERQWNVWRKEIKVPEVKGKALAQLDRDLPRVEFLKEMLHEQPESITHAGQLVERHAGPWGLGHGREWLPVGTERPLTVDVIVNFSATSDAGLTNTPSEAARRGNVTRLLQIASVLSHLDVASGCVRVSALDVGRMKVLRERVAAGDVNWNQLGREILSADQNTIDVSTLQARTKAAAFLRDYLNKLIAQPQCEGAQAGQQHALVVVSNSLLFARGSELPNPVFECACTAFYFKPALGGYALMRAGADPPDDVDWVLKPLHARRFYLRSAMDFRNALGKMIEQMERGRTQGTR